MSPIITLSPCIGKMCPATPMRTPVTNEHTKLKRILFVHTGAKYTCISHIANAKTAANTPSRIFPPNNTASVPAASTLPRQTLNLGAELCSMSSIQIFSLSVSIFFLQYSLLRAFIRSSFQKSVFVPSLVPLVMEHTVPSGMFIVHTSVEVMANTSMRSAPYAFPILRRVSSTLLTSEPFLIIIAPMSMNNLSVFTSSLSHWHLLKVLMSSLIYYSLQFLWIFVI